MIRVAREEDAERLLEIYSYYVRETAVSFEYEPPSLCEFKERIRRTLEKYPYLVSEKSGHIIGYAYAGPFHSRAAYSWSAEASIYVDRSARRSGVGKELYAALERALAQQNIINLYACIAYSPIEDGYLTHDSVRFHERMGYRFAGEMHKCGYKFGRWYGIVWMEKAISPHPEQPSGVVAFRSER